MKTVRNVKPNLKPRIISIRLTEYQFGELEKYMKALDTTKTKLIESAISRHLSYLSNNPQIRKRLENVTLA